MKTSFYTKRELKKVGFRKYGQNVFVSRKASIYSPEKITLGDNVRIDDFCIISGELSVGNNVHISAGVKMYGEAGIELRDYSGCSANSIIYSATDDFSGDYMVGAVLPEEKRNVKTGKVVVGKYAQLGAGTIVMPGVTLNDGAATGALTFVNRDLDSWSIYIGIPARLLKKRSRKLQSLIQ